MEADKLAEAHRKRRRVKEALPKQRLSTDNARGGRVGDDYDADGKLLKLDLYHKGRLMRLFDDFVSEHRWAEAAGVACLLLRAMLWWRRGGGGKRGDSRPIFTMTMEILKQLLDQTQENRTIYRRLFNLMYYQQPQTKQIESKRLQGEVELHLALYLFYSGDCEGAYNTLRAIVDGVALRDSPVANLSYGLVVHRLWYELVREEVLLSEEKIDEGSFGEWLPETGSEGAIEVKVDNEASNVLRDVEDTSDDTSNSKSPEVSMDNIVQRKYKKLQFVEDEEFWSNARVNIQPIMDRRLYPVELPCQQPDTEYLVPLSPRSKEYYDKAVEHLQQAIASAPEMTSALVPLVQLLLAVGDVEAANKEIEICYQATKSIVPLSVRALLLESLAERDAVRMAQCYEQIQEHNPSSVDALTGLIVLHENGEYETQAMVRAIAVHLDTEPGSLHIWHKLADCFLELSSCRDEDDDVSGVEFAFVFVDRISSSWWTNKHFSETALRAEGSDWKLITYKAACAAHLYGPDFSYVTKASDMLQQLKKKQLVAVLTSHRLQSLCLFDA